MVMVTEICSHMLTDNPEPAVPLLLHSTIGATYGTQGAVFKMYAADTGSDAALFLDTLLSHAYSESEIREDAGHICRGILQFVWIFVGTGYYCQDI